MIVHLRVQRQLREKGYMVMTTDAEILLQSDPKRFMEIVQNHSAEERVASLHTLDDMVACETLRHGIYNDTSKLPDLAAFYREIFLQAPTERRREIYGHVAMIVEKIGGWTAGAFFPFMILDPDTSIVSTATVDYASLGSLIDNDPMSRPRDALVMVEKRIPENSAAIFGGLLALGDPRVCELLAPVRSTLDADEISVVSKCLSGFTAKAAIEFYLDWLDELVDERDYDSEAEFGHVVAGLFRLANARSIPFVADGFRPFPVTSANGQWPDLKRLDPTAYAASIEGRLLDIEMREGVPRVVPHAIRAFGLTPRSSSDEIAVVAS